MPHAGHHVRPATSNDAPALAELGERTFRETFAADNAPENIAAHVAATYGADRQASELADPRRSTLVAATDDGELIGFAQLLAGEVPPAVTGPASLELLRLYVDGRYHGRGVAPEPSGWGSGSATRARSRSIASGASRTSGATSSFSAPITRPTG